MRFSVEGEPMGGEIEATGAPNITVSAVGMVDLDAVRVVKNGKIVYSAAPGSNQADFEFVDLSGAQSGDYYYLDLIQSDGEKAISSPVWIN